MCVCVCVCGCKIFQDAVACPHRHVFLCNADWPLYAWLQCCQDVVAGRFAGELKYEMALRLAALHVTQHAAASNSQQLQPQQGGKVSLKAIE